MQNKENLLGKMHIECAIMSKSQNIALMISTSCSTGQTILQTYKLRKEQSTWNQQKPLFCHMYNEDNKIHVWYSYLAEVNSHRSVNQAFKKILCSPQVG